MIGKWLEARKKEQAKRRFNAGYNYAVGSIVRGDETEESISIKADNPFDKDEYENGMIAGLRGLHAYEVDQEALHRHL